MYLKVIYRHMEIADLALSGLLRIRSKLGSDYKEYRPKLIRINH